MYFGKRVSTIQKLSLDGKEIEWVDSWVYLGVKLVTGKNFGCCITDRLLKFYKCANSIFRIDGYSDELTMLRLVETHCVPILTYGIEILHVSDSRERSKLRVAYNSLFRKIFGYRRYDSVREIQGFLGRPTWEELVERRKNGFQQKLHFFPPDCIMHCFL